MHGANPSALKKLQQMAIKFFKGFEIDRWSVGITIRERTPTGLIDRHHHKLYEIFESEEKAVNAGFKYGEQLVVSWKGSQ